MQVVTKKIWSFLIKVFSTMEVLHFQNKKQAIHVFVTQTRF